MFTDAERLEAEMLLGEGFSTYQENILIYKTPKISTTSSDSTFTFGFDNQQPGVVSTYVSESGVFLATVEYENSQANQPLTFELPNVNMVQPKGTVKISVSGSAAKEFLQDCEKIVIDGKSFRISSDIVARGLFDRDFYDCWLEKLDPKE